MSPKQIKDKYRSSLMALPGVLGIGVGHKQRGGVLEAQLAIIVMVAHKRPLSEVPLTQRIPAQLEGVPTDVIEGNPTIRR